jgi:hypothetical protein
MVGAPDATQNRELSMKILILVNGAPFHRPFYTNVGRQLAASGHTVHYAVDSHYTDAIYPETKFPSTAHYFSDYFKAHPRTEVPPGLRNENLWLAMYPDFDRFTHSEAAWRSDPAYYDRVLASMSRFFWELFECEGYSRIVYESVSNAFAYVGYLVAKQFGATYVGFAPSKLPGRLDVSISQYHRNPRLPGLYADVLAGRVQVPDEADRFVAEYRDTFTRKRPDYIVAHDRISRNPLSRYLRVDSFRRVARSIGYQIAHRDDFEHAYQLPDLSRIYPRQLTWEILRSLRVRELRARYYAAPDLSRRFFVYPMQFHPESTTSVNAPFYVDELTLIRNIAASMPYGMQLYVKDHRHVAAGRQPLSFYRALSRLPNVTLVDPDVDAKAMVARSRGVITNTSTMGFEALVLGRPVFLFGHTFYDFHPMARRLASYDELFDALKKVDEITPASEEQTRAFLASYYMSTYPASYDLPKRFADATLIRTVAGVILDPPHA